MELLVLTVALAGTFGIALGLSRLVLGFTLSAMSGHVSFAIPAWPWRRIAMLAGLFCLLYLIPGLADAAGRSQAGVIVRHLLGH